MEAVMFREFWRHGSNAALVFGVLIIGACAALGFAPLTPLWILAGVLVFYASEYTFHRFLFHAPPSKRVWLLRLQRRLHYDHHVEPSRLDLLFLPLWFVVPNLAITGLIAWVLLRDWTLAVSLVLGAMLALLQYEWVHYVAHIPYRPHTRFGRWMKRYHLWHHFKNEHFWFGVSNPMLDFVSGTYREPEGVARSTTVRVLHPEDQ
jgi:4-hydroxysphinganine ceramide fatty acyl 2-hydroxylase